MHEIDWSLMGSALGHVFFNVLKLSLAWTLLGIFVMKYFVRQVPLLSHAIILFWAILRVLLVVAALTFLGVIFDIPVGPLSGVLSVAGMCGMGWLITRDLSRRYGTPTEFPAVGAKVMFSMLILILVIGSFVYVAREFFT